MDLQPYSHNYFSKILRTLFDFLNNTYWVSLFQRNNLLIFQTGISCFSVTLFYSTLLALTHRQNDRRRTNTLACAWAGGTFFQLCCCVSFGSGGKYVLVLHTTTYVLRVQHSCGVVSVFWFWREIVFVVTYVLSVQYSCAVVQFFGCGGKQFSK